MNLKTRLQKLTDFAISRGWLRGAPSPFKNPGYNIALAMVKNNDVYIIMVL